MTSTIRMPVAAPALTEEGPAFPWELLQSARALDLNEDHLVLAWELARLPHALTAQEQRAVMLLTLASLAAVSQGSTRVGVAGPHAAVLSALLERLGASAADVERVQALLHEARTSGERGRLAPIVGGRGGYRPFVVDGEHLYHHRMLALEERLGALLSARLQQMPRTSEADFAGGLEDLQRRPAWAAGREVALSVEQRAAVAAAAAHALTVITGGPGTGKTAIVVAVLRLLAREGRVPLEAVALAAPTGKATDRMRQLVEASLHSVRERGAADEALLKTLPAARTLHRLLGYSPSSGRFRHHEGNPLAERFVIVDEGSMVDLALMDRLLRALRPDAQLVILGDAEQLPSVEAGAAFRDLCACIGERRRVLTWSYRMDASDPCGRAVLHVAGLVNRGEVAGLFPTAAQRPTVDDLRVSETAGGLPFEKVTFLPAEEAVDRRVFLSRWFESRLGGNPRLMELLQGTHRFQAGHAAEEAMAPLGEVFAQFDGFRVLCGVRAGGHLTGVEGINASLRERLAGRRLPDRGDYLPGEPVMVRVNDYDRGLFNGDNGIVLRVQPQASGGAQLAAVFRRERGFIAHPLESVRRIIEPAWATTVHKAQGSEFNHVAIILPAHDSRLLTRELLYTALTRARTSVTIVGTRSILEAAIRRVSERSSGLRERIR